MENKMTKVLDYPKIRFIDKLKVCQKMKKT
jgi:hypothetical protein